ncbi:hypothetical protein CYY_009276 [Polysphondylium violaceum]|uniref:Flavin-containing monooxygenase n=1 Tax=Polysphondylium violaceum TaxID=133409 RepID=A0A8J4PKE6_9MYCE|nr:hypothetical protein CYY_009276 [Polysphondylium violaceum]
MGKRIAIIGGGPGGLVSLKTAIELGLDAMLYEKEQYIGGIWAPGVGKTWHSMQTNLSYFSCMFSDYPWKYSNGDGDLFPNQSMVYQYLSDYVKHFGLQQYIKLSSGVEKIDHVKDDNSWNLFIKHDHPPINYSHIIIAIGIFSKAPSIDYSHVPGIEYFKANGGKVLSGSHYKSPHDLEKKNVVVIGGSYSGCEISTDICQHSNELINVIKRPFWYIPKTIEGKPVDVVFYSRESADRNSKLTEEKARENKVNYFKKITNNNGQIPTLQVDTTLPVFVVITPHYIDRVKEEKIKIVYANQFQGFNKQGQAIFDQLTESQKNSFKVTSSTVTKHIDQVIFCDGYRCNLSILPQELLENISYDEQDKFVPVLLHKTVFAQDFSTIFFVGMYKGPYFCSMELQARWICMIIAGLVEYPTKEEINQGIKDQKTIKDKLPKEQFPNPKYVEYCDYIAKKIGILPPDNLEQTLKHTGNQDLYAMIFHQFMSPVAFKLWESKYIDPQTFEKEPNQKSVHFLKEIKQLFYRDEQ